MTATGVDLGGTKIAGVLLDDSGNVCGEVWHEHNAAGTAEVVALISRVVEELGRRDPGPESSPVGVSIAAWVDEDRAHIWPTPNLGMPRAPFRQILADALGRPVTLENDGNATALAEATWGAGRSAEVMTLLTLGTGVGGGVVARGEVVRGGRGFAGEFGHIPVGVAGPPCICGGIGCLELYASGSALAARARERRHDAAKVMQLAAEAGDELNARHVIQAAHAGDSLALSLLDEAGRAIARAVASVAALLDPDLVVLAGSVATGAGELLIDAAQDELATRQPLRAFLPPVPIVLAQAGRNAAARGAAELARLEHNFGSTPLARRARA